MPIYEFQCQDCGEEVEVLQKLSDAPLVECSACGKPSMKKKISAAAFRLKGGGWYETDFKTGSKKNLAGGAEGGASSDSTKSASSDSKSSSDSPKSPSVSKSDSKTA